MNPRDTAGPAAATAPGGNVAEVFAVFLRLGLTCFGGPIAHLGYFHDEFVVRRKWLDEKTYADLVALCQFLPGPGLEPRSASPSACRAPAMPARSPPGPASRCRRRSRWCCSAMASARSAMRSARAGCTASKSRPSRSSPMRCSRMMRTLAPDRERATLAVAAAIVSSRCRRRSARSAPSLLGGLAGLVLVRAARRRPTITALPHPVSRTAAVAAIVAVLRASDRAADRRRRGAEPSRWQLFDAFYRAGSLVFGGGHVVLPLLQASVVPPGWVSNDAFLAGYGAAQAVPGPLFTFSAYLGTVMGPGPNGWLGAIALPGRDVSAGVSSGHRPAAVLG